jgi:NAD(P)H-dependent flavin oxidoreductase YrpB (nitropropane dioxygenase family)
MTGGHRDDEAILEQHARREAVERRFERDDEQIEIAAPQQPSSESGAHPSYVQALLDASAADTCLTNAYSDGWPDAPHRVLCSAIARAQALPDGVVGEAHVRDQIIPVTRFSVIAPTRATTGHVDAMALYAGESVSNVTSVQPAATIVAELVSGAERLLRTAAG